MTFELLTMTKAKLTDIEVLSSKDREPDANPGVSLKFSASMSNDVLTMFDGSLRSTIFGKSAASSGGQKSLDGVDPISDLPNLTAMGMKLGKFEWDDELTGYTLEIDHGMGGKSNLAIGDCVLSGFVFQGKEGGTVIVKWTVEAPDVPEKIFGKLSKLKSQEVQLTLAPPEIEQDLADQAEEG